MHIVDKQVFDFICLVTNISFIQNIVSLNIYKKKQKVPLHKCKMHLLICFAWPCYFVYPQAHCIMHLYVECAC